MPILRTALLAAILTGAPAMTVAAEFVFVPVPRWQSPPETEEVCAVVRKECPAYAGTTDIEAEFGYEELYDVAGMLTGVRMTRSTGCKPLDESLLLGQRKFKMAFHKDGQPDLDDIRAEVAPGTNPDTVRIVKSSRTSLSMGCQ